MKHKFFYNFGTNHTVIDVSNKKSKEQIEKEFGKGFSDGIEYDPLSEKVFLTNGKLEVKKNNNDPTI